MSRVVLLNGVSGVGKSSIAKALQRIAARPMLHVQMDAFLEMMPPGSFGHAEGYAFETTLDAAGRPVTAITSGPILELAMHSLRAAVAAMADEGADLVVDEVMWNPALLADYRRRLAAHDLFTVGLTAPLALIEAREAARGDRTLGLARWQHDKVHAGMAYDLELDTAQAPAEALAAQIKAAFGL
jgi:chloramphenicol 3-O phosphotransferase